MKITIYIENGVRGIDFVLPYQLLIKYQDVEIIIAASESHITTLEGVSVAVSHQLDNCKETNMLWIAGSAEHSSKAIDPLASQHLNNLIQSASKVIAIGHGAHTLAQTGALKGHQATMPLIYKRQVKSHKVKYCFARLVEDGKFITTLSHNELIKALYLALPELKKADSSLALSSDVSLNGFIDNANDTEKHIKANAKLFKKYDAHYKKHLEKVSEKTKNKAVFYLFERVNALEFFSSLAIISHYNIDCQYIGNQQGEVSVMGDGFKIIADKAIQYFKSAYLLVLVGGDGIDFQLKSAFVRHWLESVCTQSFRVVTVGRGEQLLGLSGALKDIDQTALSTLGLGEGRYIIASDYKLAYQHLIAIAKHEAKDFYKYKK